MDAKKLNESVQKDWEKTIFCISIILLLSAVFFFVFDLMSSKDADLSMSTNAPKPRSLLNEKALAFLDPVPPLGKDEKPFYFQKTFAVKQPKKVTPPPPKPPKVEPKPPETKPPPPPPPKKTTVLTMRYAEFKNIEFKGVTKSASGELLALISVFDSKTKETKDFTVAPGDKLDGLSVDMITSDMLMITNKKNETQAITLQSSEKVMLDE
ncbi:MAG: hypothetical protein A2X48_16305 [Lentisphaerae bacterium GWF2_49_21]|nr:MAG: hypothetical protein A2X48_16305 [Lentisphaerae bacterium GWF2_49_21]